MAKQANTTATAAQQPKHTGSSAANRAANPLPNMAATPTGAQGGRKQKLVYAAEGAVKLVPGAAKGTQQKAYLAACQAAFGKAGTMQVPALLAALAKANSNPRRIYRRAIRAGIIVTA